MKGLEGGKHWDNWLMAGMGCALGLCILSAHLVEQSLYMRNVERSWQAQRLATLSTPPVAPPGFPAK